VRATVAYNRPISTGYLHLGVAAPDFPATFRAGEFVMVRPFWIGDPLLPRAFSIYRVSGGGSLSPEDPTRVVEILYKVLGKGTQCLARMQPQQEIEVLGPLGNAFAPPDQSVLPVLVAGGIGVPPIAALAAQLSREPRAASRVEVFLGGKTSEDILCVKDFEEAGANVHITTEDGSLGARGLLTDLLRPFLFTAQVTRLRMYACGPSGMLAAVARLAEECVVPCEVSVEANMACGFGACMGCAIEVKADARGYKLVCKDGPVFDSREIVWR
jgi:dihydroorotate dehydrogenase electron transfer subunit